MNIFLLALITFLPALLWFAMWRFQDIEKEPFRAMTSCFLLGMLASLPFFLARVLGLIDLGQQGTFSLFLFAFLEEVVKAIMVVISIEMSHRWFTQIVDGLIYAAAVALGFSFVENLIVFAPLFVSWSEVTVSFLGVYLVRSLDTMFGHTLFTALFGFFYASAYLRKEIFPNKKKEKPWYHFRFNLWEALPLHVTLFHILPNRPSTHGHYPGSLILEGVLIASGLHGLFNVLLQKNISGTSLSFLTVPLVFFVAYLLWRMFLQRVYVRIIQRVKG